MYSNINIYSIDQVINSLIIGDTNGYYKFFELQVNIKLTRYYACLHVLCLFHAFQFRNDFSNDGRRKLSVGNNS